MNLSGLNVTIIGLGRHGGGAAAARYCALAGAIVTVTDLASESELSESLTELHDVPIAKYTLGRHDAVDFQTAEIVVVNPAVKPGNEWIELARRSGAQITSEIELFLAACPAKVIGVTGTVGKSTTAAMLAAILQAAGKRTWLGGNIGYSLLADLQQMKPDDVVVLELSSFQLFWLSEIARWPRAAIVTNCTPNHLDWHGTWEQYATAKQRLISHLPPDEICVLGEALGELSQWQSMCKARCLTVTSEQASNHSLIPPLLRVPGEHNRRNAAAAALMAQELGVSDSIITGALEQFIGLAHRMTLVRELAGRQFFNDSKATTPIATLAALAAMDRPTWLLLGGVDRPGELNSLVDKVCSQAQGAALFGSSVARLHELFLQANPAFSCCCVETLEQALGWCWTQSRPGDAILLSPGFPSTDQFQDFVHRGEEFLRLVRALADG